MDALNEEQANKLFSQVKFDVIIDDSCPNQHASIFKLYSKFLSQDGTYIIETYKSISQYFKDLSYLKNNFLNFNFNMIYPYLDHLEPAIIATLSNNS